MTFKRFLKGAQSVHRFAEILRCQRHTSQWLRLAAAYAGWDRVLPFTIAMRSGEFEFREVSDIATFWQIFYRQIYLIRPSDRVIVDAGANIGAFSLYALQAAPLARVIAVEPAPDSCQRMNSMLCANGMASRYTLFEAALGARVGETFIQLRQGSQFRRTGPQGHRVAMMTLDNLIPENTFVDLLKMDIEGAEYDTLSAVSSDTFRRIRRVVLEVHPPSPASAALDPLLANGFLLRRYEDDGGGYGIAWLERRGDREASLN